MLSEVFQQTVLLPRSDGNHLKPNAVAESALSYSTIAFSNSPSNIKRSKMDLSGKIPWHLNLFDNDYDGQKEESDKLAAVMAEAKEFLNLLDTMNSTAKTFCASLEPDAYRPHTSIGEHKTMMEIKKHVKRERDEFLSEPVMLQNLDSSWISVVVQEEKASGTETMWEDSEDEISLLSPGEWNALQLPFNHKDECAEPSIGPEGISIVDFTDPISVSTKSDKPSEQFPDREQTETKCEEHKGHDSMDLDKCSTIPVRVQDEPLKMFSDDDEAIAIHSHRNIKATNCNNEPEHCENHKELINLEIVQHNQPQGRKVMQALKLFKEEYFKILRNHDLELSRGKTITYPHLEAAVRVKVKGMCVSPDKPFGHIPGIEIGDEFGFRAELVIVGLHCQFVAGISYVNLNEKKYATSVVNSGCYENKATTHDALIYSGTGGNPKVSNNVAADQKLEKGNLSLRNSMEMGYPVRVIQKRKCLMGFKTLGMKNENCSMYVYDGLYTVTKFWRERGDQNNKLVFKFQLQRLSGQPVGHGTNESGKRIPATGVCLLDDVSKGKENFKVRVMNRVDDGLPPSFTYITSIVYPHWCQRVEPTGCNCINGCSGSDQCPCVEKNGGEIPFTDKGAIIRAYPNMVHECGPSCKCPPSCANRVSQHGPRCQLEIFKTKSMGWGVRSRVWIQPRSFICEYIGELRGDKEADQIIDNEYLFKMKDGFSIDAAKCGNMSRFINHSCDPNVFAQEVIYDNEDKRMPHVMFFASKCIPPGRELRYNYTCRK